MHTFEIIAISFFWVCFGGIAYAYIAYPAILSVLARLFGKQSDPALLNDINLPSISLLIAAYNEEAVIEERIKNALALDYPRHKLQIIIASDGSSDGTTAIVRRFADQGVRLLDYKERNGKTAMLNRAIKEVETDLVLLSDANSHTNPDAARLLARWFVNPQVGAVCGRLVLNDPQTGKNVDGMYWKYETFLKKRESKLGALLGSNGAIYAIRTALFQPIPDRTIIDDFVIPLQAKLNTNCDIVYDSKAVAHEETAPDIGVEFRRRTRIGTGGWQAIAMLWRLLNPSRGWIAFTFFSHKVLRWICPFFMIGMVAANLCLSHNSYFFHAVLRVQIVLYLLAGVGAIIPKNVPFSRFMRLANMFVSMNAALFMGFYKWLSMPHTGIWSRTPRPVGSSNGPRDPRLVSTRDLVIGGLMALAAVAILYDAWFSIFSLGFVDEELSYVLLAPVVIAWLAYSRRRLLDTCTVSHGWVGLVILIIGWAVFWYGYVADPVLWRAGAVVIAIGAFISAVGFKVLWRFAPAFAACIFLIPVLPTGRYTIAAPLQTATASATQTLCDIIGMNVDRAGNLLSINGVGVTVAEACNGMRMVLTLFMVCYVVAFTMPMRAWVRVLFLLASPLVAILSNVARLVPTIWMFGHESRSAAENFHDISGWVMTLLSFVLLLGFAKLLQGTATESVGDAHLVTV